MKIRFLGKRFTRWMIAVTLLYAGGLLLFYVASDERSAQTPTTQSELPYDDLKAAYEQLQQQLQKADSTHLIRRYHGRHALFSAERIFDERTMNLTRDHFSSQLGREKIYLDLPDFHWQRDDEARPVDVLRHTFRGNGVPDNVEQLARNALIDPKLHAFYSALVQQNTVLWTQDDASIEFAARTSRGQLYRARSTPFIAIQRLSKDYFAKMQSASLPFLWEAYVDEDEQRAAQQQLLSEPLGPPDMVGPRRPDDWEPPVRVTDDYEYFGPFRPLTQAETIASHLGRAAAPEPHGPFAKGPESVLESLPSIAEAMVQQKQRPVSSFALDERKAQALFESSVIEGDASLTETLEWKKAINKKRLDGSEAPDDIIRHLDRLSRLDPEFMTLFLINNLFQQYNVFSVFDEDVHLTINAIDTRLNVLYVSYNIRFDPPEGMEEEDETFPPGCGDGPVTISDEFFLVAAKPYSYLLRVYLPTCSPDTGEYSLVDRFISQMRILH